VKTLGEEIVEIDGSYGEGGGQILRTALALSAVLRRSFSLHHIRSRRKNPGLQAQHLTAVEALARIAGSQTEGVYLGSTRISFFPGETFPGDYRFDVKTAGSVTLLLQAILLPLSLARKSSRLTLTGGTHVPWSPPYHYVSEVLLPTLRSMGISARASIDRWGWYPRGGGKIQLDIEPVGRLEPTSLVDRGRLRRIRGLSAVSNLPRHVADRQRDRALRRIEEEMKIDAEISVLYDVPSYGSGSFVFVLCEYEKNVAGFSSLGSRGKPAEKVADEALDALMDHLGSKGCIDSHLADQLVPFMALAKGRSSFTTTRITEHLTTNLWVLQHFLKVKVLRTGKPEEGGKVEFLNE